MHLRRRQQVTTVGVAVVATALSLAACSSSSSSSAAASGGGTPSSGSSSSSSAALSGTLNGSGSTFQLVFQQTAIASFKSVQPSMTVNYGGGGSGKGRTDLASGVVKFAGSDSPIPAAETANFKGKTVLYFPVVIGPITMSYNLSGVSSPAAVGAGHRGHLRGQDHEVERLGDHGGQPRRQAAQHPDHHRRPLGLLGHHGQNFSQFLMDGRAEHLDAGQQLDHQVARHRPGRQRQRRGGADRQVHPRRHRVRGLRRPPRHPA